MTGGGILEQRPHWLPEQLLPVAIGGGAGALTRYLMVLAMAPAMAAWWATMVVNLVGSAAIGVLAAYSAARSQPKWVYPLIGTGFLGGFTTFSTYVVQVLSAGQLGQWATAGLLAVSTPVLCIAAAAVTSLLTEKYVGDVDDDRPSRRGPRTHGGWSEED